MISIRRSFGFQLVELLNFTLTSVVYFSNNEDKTTENMGPIRASLIEGNAIVRESDMPETMQSRVMELAYKALDQHEVSDCQSIACYIKQKLDEAYGVAWHCVVGKDFGSCISHLCGSFIFFHVGVIEFLIFKDGNNFSESKEEAVGVHQKN